MDFSPNYAMYLMIAGNPFSKKAQWRPPRGPVQADRVPNGSAVRIVEALHCIYQHYVYDSVYGGTLSFLKFANYHESGLSTGQYTMPMYLCRSACRGHARFHGTNRARLGVLSQRCL
jgi:hypothetical protein